MKLRATTYGVVAALIMANTVAAQAAEKRTIKERTVFLIDANTKGISEQTETKGTGISEIQLEEGRIARRAFLDAHYASGQSVEGSRREWVVKSGSVVLSAGDVQKSQILLTTDTGNAVLQNVRNGGPSFLSDGGTRRWYGFLS